MPGVCRAEIESDREHHAPGPCGLIENKHPLTSGEANPRIHGGCFGVWGHTSSEALKLQILFCYSRRCLRFAGRPHRLEAMGRSRQIRIVANRHHLDVASILSTSRLPLVSCHFSFRFHSGKQKTLPTHGKQG
jgi:hypothetical protein